MKILQIHNRYRQAGGEDTVVDSEADLLRSAGHQVLRYFGENPSTALDAWGSLAISAWNPWKAREVGALVDDYRPDVAHVHNTWYALSPSVLRAVSRRDVPVVMTLHNYRLICSNALLFRDGRPCGDCVGGHPWPGVRHRCYRDSAMASTAAATAISFNRVRNTWNRDVDLFLALSKFARDMFVAGGIPSSRMRVKSNFVVDPGPRPRPPSVSRTLLYVGRLSPEKGIERLLDAWEASPGTGLELVLVGEGPLRRELERRNLTGVRLVGQLPHDQVVRELSTARALLFPSIWYEGQPMVVLEALASGLPVMGSDLGGTAELLEPLGREWLVPPDDLEAWAAAILRLADDQSVDRAGRLGRDAYEKRFTPDVGLTGLEETYSSLI
jgi:glycosyltransferase involved in cell wall biosynthesis